VIQEHSAQGLLPELFHPHWHLYALGDAPPIDPVLLIQDPLPIRRRGRPAGATNFSQAPSTQAPSTQDDVLTPFDRSTQREPSSYEYMAEGPRGGLGGRGGRARLRGARPGRPRGSRARGGAARGATRGVVVVGTLVGVGVGVGKLRRIQRPQRPR
jgi:hypothetical protein